MFRLTMTDWRLRDAKRRGTLVAGILARAWRTSPPAVNLSPGDLALIAPVLLDSPAAALAWNKLRTLPENPFRDEFQDAYRFSGLRSEMRALDLKTVLAKLRSARVDAIVHKGWATARLYPKPEMRSYADIDLLIRPGQFETAQAALNTAPRIACPVDLEHSELTTLDDISFDNLYSRSRVAELGCDEVRILGAEHQLRSLAIHCLKHGVASPLWLADVAVATETVPADFDWDLCIGARQPQANWVRTALSLAHRLLETDIRNTPVAEFVPNLPGWVVRSVLRRWSRPPVPAPLPRLASVVKSGTDIVEALAWRWPSACQTTVDGNAMFTRLPNIHLQLQSLLARTVLVLRGSRLVPPLSAP